MPDARKRCQFYGGDLVSLVSVEEILFVRELLLTNGQHGNYWLGLSDEKLEGIERTIELASCQVCALHLAVCQ